LKQVGGARVPIYVATFILAVAFYWWTPHVLLLGRITWDRLFPDRYVRDRSRRGFDPPLLRADCVE